MVKQRTARTVGLSVGQVSVMGVAGQNYSSLIITERLVARAPE